MGLLLEYSRKDLRNWAGEELAARFFDLRQRFPSPENDLDYWIKNKTPEELKTYMDTFKSKNQKEKEERLAGAEKIYSDDKWLVVHCTTYNAMKQYGKGTKWCISGNYPGHEGRGKQYFDSYLNDRYSGYYVYINRESDDKWCVCILQSNKDEADIWNAKDYTVEVIPNAPIIKGMPDVSGRLQVDDDGVLIVTDKSRRMLREVGVIELPENTRVIPRMAFAKSRVTEVKLNSGLEEIGVGAFAQSSITSIIIPDSVKKLGSHAFMQCGMLNKAKLGKGIKDLPAMLFAFDEDLTIIVEGKINSIDDNWLNETRDIKVETQDEKLATWCSENLR